MASTPLRDSYCRQARAHGLVERQPHPEDRRRKLVTLTTPGREAIATAEAILRRPPRAIGTLRSEELRQLSRLLNRLIEADEFDDPSR